MHAIIIPNYKEDINIFYGTLEALAEHDMAKDRYMIFLAMEARETGSAEKAQLLIKKYK